MIRKITPQHRKQAASTSVYKVVRVTNNDNLKSLVVNGTRKKPDEFADTGEAVTLTYKPDRVISDGALGIWCCKTIRDAKNQAHYNGRHRLCRIYKVYPLGSLIPVPAGWEGPGIVLYPAIIMTDIFEVVDNR